MAINSVSFGAEQERQKQGSGILLPTVGLLGGGAVGLGLAMTKPQLDADTFTKALQENSDKYTSNLTADEQKLVDDAKKELKSTNNSSAPATNSDAKPAAEKTVANAENTAPKVDVSGKKSLVSEFSLEEIFKGDAELTPKEYLERKHNVSTVEELQNKVKRTNEEFFSHETANLKKGIDSGKSKEQLVKTYAQECEKKLALEYDVANLKLKIDEETRKMNLLNPDTSAHKNTQNRINSLNGQLSNKTESLEKFETKIGDLEKNIGNKMFESIDGRNSALKQKINEKLNTANSEGGIVTQAGKAAKDKITVEIEKEAEVQANKRIAELNKQRKDRKAAQMTSNEKKAYIKRAKEKAVKEVHAQKIANAEEIAKKRAIIEIKNTEMKKFVSNVSERLTQESKKWVGNQREYEKMVAAREELANDLALVQNARKNNTKITAKLAEEAIPAHGKVSESVAKAADKAAETLSNISEAAKKAVTKAYDAIKAKLPKNDFKSSWKKGAAFAAIGLGVGLVFKLIADGSSNKSAE